MATKIEREIQRDDEARSFRKDVISRLERIELILQKLAYKNKIKLDDVLPEDQVIIEETGFVKRK